MALSEEIRRARLAAGLSQQELGEKVGVSQVTVSTWELGTSSPRPANRALLVEILGDLTSRGPEDTVTQEGPSPFGAWLLKTRQERGLTRAQLSDRARVSDVAIYNLETGRTQNPQDGTRIKLTQALGSPAPADALKATEDAAQIAGVGRLTDFDPHDAADLPTGAGVYVFYDISQRPVYVGESSDMARRVREHEDKFWFRPPIVSSGSYVGIPDATLRKQVEQVLIRFLKSNAVINRQHVDR